MLGRTGVPVTMLGVGGYHIGWTSERDAQETIEAAFKRGWLPYMEPVYDSIAATDRPPGTVSCVPMIATTL